MKKEDGEESMKNESQKALEAPNVKKMSPNEKSTSLSSGNPRKVKLIFQ